MSSDLCADLTMRLPYDKIGNELGKRHECLHDDP